MQDNMTRKAGETFVFNNDILKVVDVSDRVDKWDCRGCYFEENHINCMLLNTWCLRGSCATEDDEELSLIFIKIGEKDG